MKKVYWRPRTVSRTGLILIALIALAGLFVVEQFKGPVRQPHFELKHAAAQKAREAFEAIKAKRVEVGPPIDAEVDPFETGVIGLLNSPVTSVTGYLSAKQASVNPNFAAVVVDMLKQAGVEQGDVVALGVSGSFPALNACAFAAVETLGAEPVSIASVSASDWGASVPELLWIDMEQVLVDAKVTEHRSFAASMGGHDDRGQGLDEEGKKLVLAGIERNKLELIQIEDFEANVAHRVDLYRKQVGGRPIKAYINVGGGAVSVGRELGKELFMPGLNLHPPKRVEYVPGVMSTFSLQGVPCLHLIHVRDLAERYGLPIEPLQAPAVGEAAVFEAIDYSRPLVLSVLGLIMASLYGFIRTDIGFRLLRGSGRSGGDSFPEPMV